MSACVRPSKNPSKFALRILLWRSLSLFMFFFWWFKQLLKEVCNFIVCWNFFYQHGGSLFHRLFCNCPFRKQSGVLLSNSMDRTKPRQWTVFWSGRWSLVATKSFARASHHVTAQRPGQLLCTPPHSLTGTISGTRIWTQWVHRLLTPTGMRVQISNTW